MARTRSTRSSQSSRSAQSSRSSRRTRSSASSQSLPPAPPPAAQPLPYIPPYQPSLPSLGSIGLLGSALNSQPPSGIFPLPNAPAIPPGIPLIVGGNAGQAWFVNASDLPTLTEQMLSQAAANAAPKNRRVNRYGRNAGRQPNDAPVSITSDSRKRLAAKILRNPNSTKEQRTRAALEMRVCGPVPANPASFDYVG